MAGELITAAYQVEYNGYVANGTNGIEVMRITGFDLPELRLGDRVRAGDHGMYPGTDLLGGRNIEVELELWASSATALAPLVEQVMLMSTPGSGELPLVFRVEGWDDDLYVECKPRRRSGIVYEERVAAAGVFAKITLQYFATDPRLYSKTETATPLTIATSASGMTFPETPPITFGSGSSNIVTITNLGNFNMPPRVVLSGDLSNPGLENVTTGDILQLTGELAAGETMTIDFLNRTVLLDGTASRYSWVNDPTGWWSLLPGDNSIRLIGTGAGSGTLFTRSAWV